LSKRRVSSSGTRRAASKRRLEATVQAVQLKWGSQALRKGAAPVAASVPALSTGLPRLDHILAVGGLPLGHISELVGQSTSGKRTLALHILAEAQGRFPCIYLDLAQTLDPAYAAACHVDLSQLAIATPASPGQALDLACDLAASGHFGLVIFDSTAVLSTVPLPSGAAATALRRLRQALQGKASAMLFLATPGDYPPGFALEQGAAVRLLVSRQRWLRRLGGGIRGYEAQVVVLRNRWSEAGRQTRVRITFNGVHVAEAPG
jgi:hypothetical protein